MNKLKLTVAMSLFAAAISGNLSAQDSNTDSHTITISVPEVALVDIEPAAAKNITLGFTAPTEAGSPILPSAANTTLWLNYSTIKSDTKPSRSVSVKLNAIIPGIDVHVTAAAPTGAGAGALGTSAGLLTLSAADQTIISGIGSAYTGNGANNGHNLTYALAAGSGPGGVASYSDLLAKPSILATVVYTLIDN
ncbi:uncharacterized protein CHSO_4612 [Chryseobacterium sp. StRB126]|uniref:hypothetical protein n=1 Tax=Chryseobacterium sp. StRB126 TaxID=878220 RepID=UPI0004E99166|nr:hypothetical protein [Chryseobacterium sp. StRB126]BAP33649.1 uncharacterized protein CHSO_4612 [Chryseobacterium sp. StRB126]